MRSKVMFVAAALSLSAASAHAQAFTQGFDDITTLPAAGWVQDNNSAPVGLTNWFQGNPTVFPAHQGATNAYIGANFNNGGGLATISNWLLTPPATLVNGATLTFWTRKNTPPDFPDRLQVRMSTAGAGTDVGTGPTDVGTFTTLMLDINPTYTSTGYPLVWTQFTVTVSGVATPTLGRLAFRYFVENAGPQGSNSDFIGIDTVEFTPGVVAATVAPVSLSVDAAGNGVMQPGEAATLAPRWRNTSTVAIASLTGALSAFTGPSGPTYTINDGAAAYGPLAANAEASCTADCYAVTASASVRPAAHWDASVVETVSTGPTAKTWTLHVGDSFTDVTAASPFYRFIETIVHKGVTAGCTATAYCPASTTTREQMAVFVLVAKEPAGYSPVACGTTPMFTDVPATSPFCKWIEELARRGVASGCGTGLYCPSSSVTREQMAVFVLRTLDPALNPPNCGTPMFADVPASSPFCKWVEELARRAVVTGCGGGNYCPASPVTREQMGVFLTVTFGLTLYGL
jgi:hypothetical protein